VRAEGAAVDASKLLSGYGQCSIEPKQVEEVFMRSQLNQKCALTPSMPRAQGLALVSLTGLSGWRLPRVFTYFAEWCRDNRKLSSSFFKIPLDLDVGGTHMLLFHTRTHAC
jgi:hypothetical protein